ncbi:MAG: hypothetical protein E3J69_11595 [Anaerolineales bacterium]|nr:MAG: hypothetical protein E3J69_11595 [Anaerolineales bacterium]
MFADEQAQYRRLTTGKIMEPSTIATLTFQVRTRKLMSLKSFGVGLKLRRLSSPESFPHTSFMICVTGDFIMRHKQFAPAALAMDPGFTSLLHPFGFNVTLFA